MSSYTQDLEKDLRLRTDQQGESISDLQNNVDIINAQIGELKLATYDDKELREIIQLLESKIKDQDRKLGILDERMRDQK